MSFSEVVEKNLIELKKFLDKMGFLIKIRQTEQGFAVIYPGNPETKIDYSIVLNNNNTAHYLLKYNLDNKECVEKSKEVPQYAVELMICSHIRLACRTLGYNPELVCFYDKNLNEIVDFPTDIKLDRSNKAKRTKLIDIFRNIDNKTKEEVLLQAKKSKVVEGLHAIHKL